MNTTTYLLLSLFSSYFITRLLIPYVISAAKSRNLLDRPDGRKQHKEAIPALGGIAIFAAFATVGFFWIGSGTIDQVKYLFPAMIVLFATGLWDDIHSLSAGKKYLFQLLAVLLIAIGGYRVTDLHGLFGIHALPVLMQYVVTVLFVTAVINAYNLVDGVDGLAGGISLIAAIAFSIIFYFSGDMLFCALSTILAASIFGFLNFNFHPAKIFMGDTGSLMLGFLLAIFGIRMLSIPEHILETLKISNPFSLLVGFLFLPVFDTIRVFSIRMTKGHSPFRADRRHLHHLLQKNNLNSIGICIAMYATTILFLVFSWIFQPLNTTLIVVLLFSFAVALAETLTIAHLVRSRKRLEKAAQNIDAYKKSNQFIKHLLNA
ncbi:MAG: undecaprenyl/decaprenyl-phosphate alpha-N-acetylglucosaminyl 1-phosphate transferase [Bacteroidetes bacterium]|nr:undecaprenyl/decaprenyl-phosphate alpha-N-acetylglucosaminyl 1-phosphate transferase [Bacteroidota bacterium]